MSHKMKSRIAIVDDHPIVLEGLVKLLGRESIFSEISSFATGQKLLDFLSNESVDIILLDITLPDSNGIELCGEIKKHYPQIIVLAFSNHSGRSAIMKMLDKGANGYLLKSASPQEIISCIKMALTGAQAFSEEVRKVLEAPDGAAATGATSRLSAREMEILTLIAAGHTTPQIAKTLYLSKFTIENHRKNILQKLQVKNVAELMAEAARQGWIEGPER